MDIVAPEIVSYLTKVSDPSDPILKEMEDRARKTGFPIVGPLVGRLLRHLSQLIGAQRILELGSGFGYSAYWFRQALGTQGELILTDWDQDNLDLAREYLGRGSPPSVNLRFCPGDAFGTLEELEGELDVIFNDTKKEKYPEVINRCMPSLRSGGLLISDNALWHGRVLTRQPDAETLGVLEYNRLIFAHPKLSSMILPLRDGVAVSRKL